jgi:hypothetical protein
MVRLPDPSSGHRRRRATAICRVGECTHGSDAGQTGEVRSYTHGLSGPGHVNTTSSKRGTS